MVSPASISLIIDAHSFYFSLCLFLHATLVFYFLSSFFLFSILFFLPASLPLFFPFCLLYMWHICHYQAQKYLCWFLLRLSFYSSFWVSKQMGYFVPATVLFSIIIISLIIPVWLSSSIFESCLFFQPLKAACFFQLCKYPQIIIWCHKNKDLYTFLLVYLFP